MEATDTKLTADIIIVGGGGAGLTAAVAALDAGGKNIIILEKAAKPGGNTAQSAGMFAVNSPAQKRKGIEVSADDGRRMTNIEITDTGCGIPGDHLKRIFEPFYSTKGAHGNGLGLPAVQRIVEAHGGTVSVESETGRGTSFRIGFPYAATL